MRQHSPQPHSAQLAYLPGIDGLRALAVGAVLLYHADLAAVPGGFLGVEVFFVISGYLITVLMLAGWQQHGRVHLGAFWLRRARRLLPAMAALLLAVLAWAVLALPAEVAGLRYDALAAAGYSTNWYLILQQRSYFETIGRPSLLLHLWSLAVEAQFYLIWPLLFAAGIRLGRHRLLALVLLGAVASAGSMALRFQPDIDPSRLYYGTDTRASGLLLGAALALIALPAPAEAAGRTIRVPLFRRWLQLVVRDPQPAASSVPTDKRPSSRELPYAALGGLIDLAGLGALALLGYWFITVNEFQSFVYQGGLLAVGLATATVIAAVAHPRAWLLPRLLGAAPLRWLGLRSYSLYLWHWPVFMVTRPQLDTALDGWVLLALRLALATLLAEASYRWVEQPFRTGALGSAWRRLWAAQGTQRWRLGLRWLASLLLCFGLGGLLSRAVVLAQPPAPPAYLAEAELEPAALAAPSGPPVRQVVAAAPTQAPTSAPPTPPPDLASGFALEAPTVLSQARAAYAPPPATPTPVPAPELHIIAIGDSVMAGAATALGESIAGIDIDTLRGRQAAAVIKLLAERRAAGQLGELVIIHTGNNGPFSARQFDAIMEQLADVDQVVFVNVRVPRRWERPNNAVIAEGTQRYPHVLLVDWYAASVGHPELFWRDGIHLRPAGARYYADLISAATRAALAMR